MPQNKPSRLYLTRKRLGYQQKQIALILSQTIHQISRYETGARIPSLKTALKFEIIYGLPVRVLFADYYKHSLKEANTRVKGTNPQPPIKLDEFTPNDYCAYAELMNTSFLDNSEKEKIRRHVRDLMKERADKGLGN